METFLNNFAAHSQCCKWHFQINDARESHRVTIRKLEEIHRANGGSFPKEESPQVVALVDALRSSAILIKLLEDRILRVYEDMQHQSARSKKRTNESLPGTPTRYKSYFN